ncbi:MAG: FkbM family methyltransferase [Cyclobacteriaceae bacterium]|nr:FkbM family methyltransferase [Cyclobacteriaceae bacterium]
MVLDSFHKRIPRKIFLTKNVLDYIETAKGQFTVQKDEVRIELTNTHYLLRRSGSDLDVFNQIIIERGLNRILQHMKTLKNEGIHILDCGANIGLATLTFKKEYPLSKIISLEPEPGNYNQLCKNISLNGYSEITPLAIGVWFEKNVLTADRDFRDRENWSFAIQPGDTKNAGGIPVDSPDSIAKLHGWERIDVLKIDIEGSEFPLFRNVEKWGSILETVQIISIEVHEEVGPLFEIAEILWRKGFKLEMHGELLIAFRN